MEKQQDYGGTATGNNPPPYPPQPAGYQQQSLGSSGPSYPQPGYGGGPPNIIVTTPQYAPQVVVAQSQIKPSNYLGLAIVTCLCCNFVLGIIAIIMSVMSDSAYGEGNIESARQYGRVSMILSAVGIALGVVVIIIVIIMFFAVWNQAVVYYNCALYTNAVSCNDQINCIWRSGYCQRD